MTVKTVYLLIGPKGSGKSFIGKLFDVRYDIPFLYVEDWARTVRRERDVSDDSYVREVFQAIDSGVRKALDDHDAIVFESTGLSEAFDNMLAGLKRDFRIISIRVAADAELCLTRIQHRDASIHVPVTTAQIRDINSRVMSKALEYDFILQNDNATEEALADQIGEIIRLTTRRYIQVTCAIILHGGRVLVTQRSADMKMPLKWEFPGGKIEPGESPEDCLLREIREELGISIRLLRSLSPSDYTYKHDVVRLYPFVADYTGGDIVLAEHADYRWLEPHQLRDLDWAEADVAVLEEFLRIH